MIKSAIPAYEKYHGVRFAEGTAEAAVKLVEQLGGKVVKRVCVMELAGLEGRKKLGQYDVESLIVYEGK